MASVYWEITWKEKGKSGSTECKQIEAVLAYSWLSKRAYGKLRQLGTLI